MGVKEVIALRWGERQVTPRTSALLHNSWCQPRGQRTKQWGAKVSSSVLVLTLSLILLGHFTGSCLSFTELDHLEVPICLLFSFSFLPCGKNGTTIPPSSEPPPPGRSLEVTRNQDSSWLAIVISQSESHSCQPVSEKHRCPSKLNHEKQPLKVFSESWDYEQFFLKCSCFFKFSNFS